MPSKAQQLVVQEHWELFNKIDDLKKQLNSNTVETLPMGGAGASVAQQGGGAATHAKGGQDSTSSSGSRLAQIEKRAARIRNRTSTNQGTASLADAMLNSAHALAKGTLDAAREHSLATDRRLLAAEKRSAESHLQQSRAENVRNLRDGKADAVKNMKERREYYGPRAPGYWESPVGKKEFGDMIVAHVADLELVKTREDEAATVLYASTLTAIANSSHALVPIEPASGRGARAWSNQHSPNKIEELSDDEYDSDAGGWVSGHASAEDVPFAEQKSPKRAKRDQKLDSTPVTKDVLQKDVEWTEQVLKACMEAQTGTVTDTERNYEAACRNRHNLAVLLLGSFDDR